MVGLAALGRIQILPSLLFYIFLGLYYIFDNGISLSALKNLGSSQLKENFLA